MRPFSERNPLVIGAIGVGIILVLMLVSVNYDKLPFFSNGKTYSAYFAEAGGLMSGNVVQVSGFRSAGLQRRAGRTPGAGQVRRRRQHPPR